MGGFGKFGGSATGALGSIRVIKITIAGSKIGRG